MFNQFRQTQALHNVRNDKRARGWCQPIRCCCCRWRWIRRGSEHNHYNHNYNRHHFYNDNQHIHNNLRYDSIAHEQLNQSDIFFP